MSDFISVISFKIFHSEKNQVHFLENFISDHISTELHELYVVCQIFPIITATLF